MKVEFDWSDSIAIPSQSAIAVYLDEDFNLVLRQQNENGEPDSIIKVAAGNCLALCAVLLREAGEHQFRLVRLPDGIALTGDGHPIKVPRDIVEKLFDQHVEDA